MHWLLMFTLLAADRTIPNPNYSVSALAGSADRGDGKPANTVPLSSPSGIAEDASGAIYVSETDAGVIRRITPDGVLETFAGTGNRADGAAGAAALATDLHSPGPLAIGRNGVLYFADGGSCRIRSIGTDGIVRDVAGTGKCSNTSSGGGFPGFPGGGPPGGFPGGGGGNSGRDGEALSVDLSPIGALAFDGEGKLLLSEPATHVVRRLDSDGQLRTIAGIRFAAFSGDGGDARSASLNAPVGLAVDSAGNIYIGDGSNCRVRRIDTGGVIDTLAGAANCASTTASFNGNATTALHRIGHLAWNAETNELLIAMPRVYRVVKFNLETSRLSSHFGNGRLGTDLPAQPLSVNVNEADQMLVSARYGFLTAAATSYQVFQLKDGQARRFAGRWPQLSESQPAAEARFMRLRTAQAASGGRLLICDTLANRVSVLKEGVVTPLAGRAYPAGFTIGDVGPALEASLDQPISAVENAAGEVYLIDRSRLRLISTDGRIRTILPGLDSPIGLALDPAGRVVFSDTGRHRVQRYDPVTRLTTTIAGTGTAGFSGDGAAAKDAQLDSPGDVAIDADGAIYIADRNNLRVRRVTTGGTIETVAGNGFPFSYADISGQEAAATGLGGLTGLAVDSDGSLLLAEPKRVLRVRAGRLQVVTGYVSADDAGAVTYFDSKLNEAVGMTSAGASRIAFADSGRGRLMLAEPLAAQ